MRKKLNFLWGLLLGIGLVVAAFVFLLIIMLSPTNMMRPESNYRTDNEVKQKTVTEHPDSVLSAKNGAGEYNVVTVEMAIEDLCKYVDHPYLDSGIVTFDKLTFSYPNLDTVEGTFWFIITASESNDPTTYYAKVPYYRTGDNYDNDDTNDIFILERSEIVFSDHEIGG